MENFRLDELQIYQLSIVLKRDCIQISSKLPEYEKYLNKKGILRTSRSVSENIAEGYGRFHYQEMIQFCRIARGSLFELIDHFDTSSAHGYITKEEFNSFKSKIIILIKKVNGYIKYLENSKK